jgi:hypothetical protein
MFSGLPQVADIVGSAFQYLANPPQLRIARFGPSNSMLGCGPTTPQDYPEKSGFGGNESVSVVTVGIAPTQTRRPTHAHLHFWQ